MKKKTLLQSSSFVTLFASLVCIAIGLLFGFLVLLLLGGDKAYSDGFKQILLGGFYMMPSGIGKEIVRGVVNGGGHAVILDLNEEKAKATAAELGNCSVYKIDLGDKDNIRAVMAKILGDFERVDVLIN